MKITGQQIRDLVLQEVNNLPQELREGVLDYLKGAGGAAAGKAGDTGKSIAKAIGDKATAAKNKVGQVAGDIKSAGQQASLKADVQKAIQQSGMAMEEFKNKFTDLLARAQSLRISDLEEEIKSELNAIDLYQNNAGGSNLQTSQDDQEYADIGRDMMATDTSEEPEDVGADLTPSTPPTKTTPAPVGLPPKANPKPVSLPQDNTPFDWRSNKAKGATPGPTTNKPAATITGKTPPKKPPLRTKLDKASIKKAVDAAGGDVNAAARKLGITKKQMIQALS